MTKPIDEMSQGEATAEILRRVRAMEERGGGRAVPVVSRALDHDEAMRLTRLYLSLRQEVTRLKDRIDAVSKHVGYEPEDDFKKQLDELERMIAADKDA